MDLKRLFLAGLLVAAAAALSRALVTRHGVGPFEYATGALLVALLLRAAYAVSRRARHTA